MRPILGILTLPILASGQPFTTSIVPDIFNAPVRAPNLTQDGVCSVHCESKYRFFYSKYFVNGSGACGGRENRARFKERLTKQFKKHSSFITFWRYKVSTIKALRKLFLD
jgi:hypothetical protein